MVYRIIIVAVMILALSSCFSPVKISNADQYVINCLPASIVNQYANRNKGVILIAAPEVRPIYNTNRMAYTKALFKIDYFSQSEWAETPAQMVQSLLVNGLSKTGGYKAVVTPPFSAHYDYMLNSSIERFHERLAPGIPTFEVAIRVQLINANTNKVVASELLSAYVPHRYTTPYSTVIAANKAMTSILRQVVNLTFNERRR
jgi:cholesterol transport system auxiliary component